MNEPVSWMSRKPVPCECPGCHSTLPSYRNANKRYCRQLCQKRATYLRVNALKMFRGGVSLADIARDLGARIEVVTRWCGKCN